MSNMKDLSNEFWERLTDSRPDTLAVMSEKTGIYTNDPSWEVAMLQVSIT